MKIIVAADKNWGIGKDNKLLVSIPADMKMFRQETTGKVCVMGRKTLESFPGGLPLKNRINIVLTRNENYKVKDAIIVHSIEELMEELKKYRWIELSHPLNNHSPYWAGIPEGAVELGKTAYDWGNELECLIQTFKFPGQFGTHIDFPGHFVKGEPLSEQYTVRNMAYPLVVIDVSEKVKEDVHYAVTVEDIKAYEEKFGDIPDGAFVALRTGWSERWPDMDAISNVDENGGEHFPGWSMEALQYIYEVRNAAANGHETLDTDASALAEKAGDLACERYLLGKGKLQVEVMCNLDQVPPAGAIVFVAFLPIEGATGLPVRMWAIAK